MKKLLLAIALMLSLPAWSATYYVCKCDTGAEAGCAAGNTGASDANSAVQAQSTATPWLTVTATAFPGWPNLVGGDNVQFCKGGGWASQTEMHIWNANVTRTSRLTIDSYAPPWGGAAQPILQFSVNNVAFKLYDPGNAANEGFTIRNLDLRGTGTVGGTVAHGAAGVRVYGNTDYVTLESLTVRYFTNGVEFTNVNSTTGPAFMILRSSAIRDNLYGGVLFGTNDSVIESNTFTNNGNCDSASITCAYGDAFRHSVYIGGEDFGTYRVVVRNNTMTQTSYQRTLTCKGTVLTAHGKVFDMLWEGNLIYETTTSAPGCYGINYTPNGSLTDEGLVRGVIRGNTVVNVGNIPVNLQSTQGVIVENNNVIVNGATGSDGFTVVAAPALALASTAHTFRNNSVYMASGSSGSGFRIDLTGTGTGNIVTNNLVYIAGGTANCWNVNGKAAADFTIFNYNLCHNLGSGNNVPPTGLNTNGLTSDPLLVTNPPVANAWSMQIQAGSPAKNAGTNGYCSVRDRLFLARDSFCDMGAYEQGASASTLPPVAPINLR